MQTESCGLLRLSPVLLFFSQIPLAPISFSLLPASLFGLIFRPFFYFIFVSTFFFFFSCQPSALPSYRRPFTRPSSVLVRFHPILCCYCFFSWTFLRWRCCCCCSCFAHFGWLCFTRFLLLRAGVFLFSPSKPTVSEKQNKTKQKNVGRSISKHSLNWLPCCAISRTPVKRCKTL